MPRRDNDWGGFIAFLIGLWLVSKVLKSKEVEYYRCWNCNRIITPYTSRCPFCRAEIDWTGTGYGNPSKPPKRETGFFNEIRFLGFGFLFSLAMLALITFFKPDYVSYWSYIVAVLGGYLAGNAKATVSTP